MTHQTINRIIAVLVFVATAAMYLVTIAPTVVFWDVGEFIAAAYMMQVPHPPGSPMFLLLTRVAMMIPFASDLAVRAHALSAILSASAIMFLYLVIMRVITKFRGMPTTFAEKVLVFGSAVIGAMSLALSTTYWDNSIEAEVYGASMFFLSAILWLVMRWLERSDKEGNEKYILLIAYLIGLSLGVHLLALLSIFPVLMIMYFKKYEYSFNGFVKLWLVAIVTFAIVYPGIVKWLPGMMDGDFMGTKSDVVAMIPWVLIVLVCYGVYSSYKKKQRVLHVALLSIVLIFFGYTTYTGVIIRSNVKPPMNENDPSNLARLTSYLGREQYGNAPVFQRRYSQEPQHQGIYTNYTSDMDFLIRYQLNHMFTRYLFWNYAGSEGDWQDARANLFPLNDVLNGVADLFGKTTPFGGEGKDSLLCIPLLIGLLGVYYQFKRDWKMGIVFVTMFLILGPVLALYQNQQEPQPRERDYFYVGAFFVFSLWIAIGIVAVHDYARQFLKSPGTTASLSFATIILFAAAIPANMVRVNFHSHDRRGDYVAWDYSYNILQTCEKDAILFTNGDNDTFPLWYLQDVEGIRRDVRIVNLSLVNTPWYIQQMKDKPYFEEAKAVPISLSDAQIARILPVAWETKTLSLPVPREVFLEAGVTDTAIINRGRIDFSMRHTLQFGATKAIRVQDILARDIVFTNQWKRPIYFAVTCSPDSKIGLDDYLWFDGLAWRLLPKKVQDIDRGIRRDVLEANLFNEPEGFSKTPQYGYKFRNIGDPDVYFDENSSRLMINYRSAFIRLALYYANAADNPEKSLAALDRMEELIPRSKVPMGWELTTDIAGFYKRLGREEKFLELVNEVEPELRRLIDQGQVNMNSYYNPYRALLEIYESKREFPKALELLNSLTAMFPNDPGLQQRIRAIQNEMALQNPTLNADTPRNTN